MTRDEIHHIVRNSTCVIYSQVKELSKLCPNARTCPNIDNELFHCIINDIYTRLQEIEKAIA